MHTAGYKVDRKDGLPALMSMGSSLPDFPNDNCRAEASLPHVCVTHSFYYRFFSPEGTATETLVECCFLYLENHL